MTDPETPNEINTRTSSIVRIAYHQLSVMCGTHDPTAPTSVVATNAEASALRNAYAVTKDSHKSVAAILGSAEDGMRAGWRAIDNAVSVGLDFMKERMQLPPGQIASMMDGVRNIFTSALETFRVLFGGIKNRIEDLSVANKTQEEIRKASS
ncbi:uncharacterized protein [Anoplolepis gracilipes]|uniref:uncharacterized protein n=1 Tax=Anoplolepis gracilipes TaxID=354296 RepID=UPI003B9E5BAA